VRRVLAFALVGGLALTACSSSSGTGHAALAAKRAASRTSTTSTTAPFVDATDHTPGTLRHYEGAREDVHDTTCAADGDAWRATGTVTNRTKRDVRYRIYASFLAGDTTVGIAETAAGPVHAGESASWTARVEVDDPGLRCILRVERTGA
jgi:hypothetical protein